MELKTEPMEAEEDTTQSVFLPRLGQCQQCGTQEAKYKCPKCETTSCCLDCVRAHKKATECNGQRDRTAYKSLSQFTELDLLSDYRLLEEASRSVDAYYRDSNKKHTRFNRDLPVHLHRMRSAAAQRGTQLRYLPPNFVKHKANTTYLDWKTKKLEWRVEWRLTWSNLTLIDAKVDEAMNLGEALKKAMIANASPQPDQQLFSVFLPAEHTPGQNGRFYKMDLAKSIADNLKGVIIVEFPVFHCSIDNHNFPLVGDTSVILRPKPKTVKSETESTTSSSAEDDDEGPSSSKKSRLTFFELSEGELSN